MGNNEEEQGIKLFGKTITLHGRQVKEEQNQRGSDQPQAVVDKRPDKIIPCPRCKSMETKFCYFNNYNVNQPRHFCKGCQRYWTAGGALRNVPVGAGRRKTKPPGRGLPDGCLYDVASGDHHHQLLHHQLDQFDLEGVLVEDWHPAAAAHGYGGFQNAFPVKRRRSNSGGQLC